ncbi:MAG: hypothetical protein BWY83_01870 [bacterium ADurb.Bin478]|nr:MAG: hypothetical protein BWY83_01870 [bacterium ADurb.Bin478]
MKASINLYANGVMYSLATSAMERALCRMDPINDE